MVATAAAKPDLTMREVATVLGVHLTTVKRMCADGRLDSYRLGGGRQYKVRIRREELDRLRQSDEWREVQSAQGTRRRGDTETA